MTAVGPRLFSALVGTSTSAKPDPQEARSALVHLGALVSSKTADGLVEPKLILTWLLTSVGAPGVLVGALVPVREAGALLPQMILSRWVLSGRSRRLAWSMGAAGQALAAAALAAAVLTLQGVAAGAAVLGALALYAVSRALCSIAHKDALARSIQKSHRGAITGLAASVAAALGLGVAIALALGLIPLSVTALGTLVVVAALLYALAGVVFLLLPEKGQRERQPTHPTLAIWRTLRAERQLRVYLLTRALLTVTALAPPYLVLLAGRDPQGQSLGSLGPLLLASAAASILAGYVWGRLSDRSSRRTLALAATLAAGVLAWRGAWR